MSKARTVQRVDFLVAFPRTVLDAEITQTDIGFEVSGKYTPTTQVALKDVIFLDRRTQSITFMHRTVTGSFVLDRPPEPHGKLMKLVRKGDQAVFYAPESSYLIETH